MKKMGIKMGRQSCEEGRRQMEIQKQWNKNRNEDNAEQDKLWEWKCQHLRLRCQEAHWTGIAKSAQCSPMEQVWWAESVACSPADVPKWANSCTRGCASCTDPGTGHSWTPQCWSPANMTNGAFTQQDRQAIGFLCSLLCSWFSQEGSVTLG